MINKIRIHLRTPLFLNGYLLLVMRVVSTGFGFLFWALAARTMSADDVGLASGTIAVTMLLAGLAQFGLGYGLVRHLSRAENPNQLLNLSIVISALASITLAVLFLITLSTWSPALLPLRSTLFTSLLFIVLVLSWTLSVLLHWVFIATRRVIFSLTRQTSHQMMAVILLFVFLPIMPGFLAVLSAHTLATLCSALLSFQVLPKAQPGYRFSLTFGEAEKKALRSHFAYYSFANYLVEQLQKAPMTILPLLVINEFGASGGAYFFVVWTMGKALSSSISSISLSLFAEGAHDPAKATTYAWRAIKLGGLLTSAFGVLIIVGGRLILSLYGQEYVDNGLHLLYLLTLSSVPTVWFSVFTSLLRIRDQLKELLIIEGISNFFSLLLTYLGIITLGFVGAGIGWLVAQVLILVVSTAWWWQHNSKKGS